MKYEENKIYSAAIMIKRKQYEMWKGNNKFFCKGKIYAG